MGRDRALPGAEYRRVGGGARTIGSEAWHGGRPRIGQSASRSRLVNRRCHIRDGWFGKVELAARNNNGVGLADEE